ncbi:hypothetical protein BJF93_08020 [Xaviernesmea oryzae]|uniref:Type II secretion system protein GspF domain-containing protein n=1 Tax=Xaviernesmea oryzae TaxID=464029 RepID=A0A1Q9AW90_9HYPH|nr:hypothetical protein BJF93_08020 [Xaviernesmea oryzae]
MVDAQDRATAETRLRAAGLLVSELRERRTRSKEGQRQLIRMHRRFNNARFFSGLAILMNAGMAFDLALRAMRNASENPKAAALIDGILESVAAGETPSSAFQKAGIVDGSMTALLVSGERSGRLGQVIQLIAQDLERNTLYKKQLIGALVYPAFLIVMMFTSVAVVMFVLVPALEPVFESSGRPSPIIIRLLGTLNRWLDSPEIIGCATTFAIVGVLFGCLRPAAFKAMMSRWILRVPVLGRAVLDLQLANYLQSMALLVENGVPLPEALELAAGCFSIPHLREKFATLTERVAVGQRLPDAIRDLNVFSGEVASLIAVGDEVNRLPAVLANAALICRTDGQQALDRLMALMTPAITIIMGALIGGLVISVMTALLSIDELSLS